MCKKEKSLSLYYANNKAKDKKTNMCKLCYKEYHRKRQTPALRETRRQYRENSAEKFMYWNAKKRAKQFNLEFNLELSDIIIPKYCPYLKVKLTRIQGDGRQPYNPSLDRIDPNKGYEKGNIEVISNKANIMKNNASVLELVSFSQSILERFTKCE